MTEEKQKKNTPVGIILILILFGLSALGILMNVANPIIQVGPFLLTGILAILVNLIYLVVFGLVIYGVVKKYAWSRTLAIVYYIYSMVLSIVNLVSFYAKPTMYTDYLNSIFEEAGMGGGIMAESIFASTFHIGLIFGVAFTWVIGVIVVVYLYKKRDYFSN